MLKRSKHFRMLSNVNGHEEILNHLKIHVHHGFEGEQKGGKKANKQIVVQTWEIEYN